MDNTAQFVLIAKRTLHELRMLNEAVTASLRDLQKQIETIAKDQQTKNERKYTPPVLRADLQIPEAIKSNWERENTKKIRREWFAIGVGVLTLFAVVAYAIMNYHMWRTMDNALDEARKQTRLMQAGQRPWLGLNGQVNLSNIPSFRFFNPKLVNLNMEGTVVVKNFGTSPAFDVNGMVRVYIPSPTDTITRPEKKMWMTCPEGPTARHEGEVVFPGSGYVQGFSQQTSVELKHHPQIGRVWLLGCIAYHDGYRVVHHTRFWLRSTFPDNAKWIMDNRNFRHMPIIGFESWGEEAD